MEIIRVGHYDEMSEIAAILVAEQIHHTPDSTLGLATGSTPEGVYKKLIHKYEKGEVSFENVTTFNLDEYVGLPKTHQNSYHSYMKNRFFNHININPNHVNIPNGLAIDLEQECINYESQIDKIDIQILGLGINGHIGFNEPGTAFTSRTHVVQLTESTRIANSRYFSRLEDVPYKAITMGIETIFESTKVILMVSGKSKAEAVKRLAEGGVSEDFPASILKRHPDVKLIADHEALHQLS